MILETRAKLLKTGARCIAPCIARRIARCVAKPSSLARGVSVAWQTGWFTLWCQIVVDRFSQFMSFAHRVFLKFVVRRKTIKTSLMKSVVATDST